MSKIESQVANTIFDALLASLQTASTFNRDDVLPPAAILWPDEKREWERVLPRIRTMQPHFLTLGPYDPANRTGPALWLRCVLAGKIPEIRWVPDVVPIIYMPGVSRSTLRATEECPADLKPLAELQYRGMFWSQYNGKDWTITAFMQTNHGGLELKIVRDNATATSIRRAIERLLDVPLVELRSKSVRGELNSTYFDSLITDDLIDDLLSWLSDPKGTRERWEVERWETMCSRCVADYGFDPTRDGELTGAEMLGVQPRPVWKTAWKRYVATPSRYPGLIELLRRAKPSSKGMSLFESQRVEFWPQDNETEETTLRQALLHVTSEPVMKARLRLLDLEKNHRKRRDWVWAKLNRAPVAHALQYLATLAEVTQSAMTGATVSDMVQIYTDEGWKADAAVLESLAAIDHPHDLEAVCAAIAHVYLPWLRDAAELFQERIKQQPLPGKNLPRLDHVPTGTCLMFVDGLRYDVSRKLKIALDTNLGAVQLKHHFVALPSVTATSKPAVSPIASKLAGTAAGLEFLPCVSADNKDLSTDRFQKLLRDEGYQFLTFGENGDPSGRAWTEFGNLDKTGHEEGIGLARRIPELIRSLVIRIESLLASGWQEVRLVTDHGWLLMPNGLPKTELPVFLTETRWGRCAVVKPNATVDLPTFSWFWGEDVRIACPPGIDCFIAGHVYNHGGISLQECVVPQLSVRAGATPVTSAKIESFKWGGLRVRVKTEGSFIGCKVDLRDKAADSATSLTGDKAVDKDGAASLFVEDDSRTGSATTLVLLDAAGNVLDKALVTVGG